MVSISLFDPTSRVGRTALVKLALGLTLCGQCGCSAVQSYFGLPPQRPSYYSHTYRERYEENPRGEKQLRSRHEEEELVYPQTPGSSNPVSQPKPPIQAPTQAPAASVISTLSPEQESDSRREAQKTISEVNRRLALAEQSGPSARKGDLALARKLVHDAQQAYEDHDYLTAHSLAQKAAVLVSRY